MAPHPAPSPLIPVSDLLALISGSSPASPELCLLDCRFSLADTLAGERAYEQGHLPGAFYAHLDRDLSGAKTGLNGRHPLPTPEAMAATMGHWGVGPATQVVAYDDAGGMFAARAWWLLGWMGHAKVRVLDGGWAAWQAVEGTLSTALPERAPTAVAPQARHDWVVGTPEVLAQVMSGQARPQGLQLLDARTAERFRGIGETLDPIGGHIPGALNRWYGLNLQADGQFKPPAQLHDEFTTLLADQPPSALVHQCGSGVTACHNLLAMAQAGLGMSRLYAGSWSEWCADPSRPVAN